MNDFDFIKDKFDKDGVAAPDSISEAAIAQKLPSKVKLYQKQSFKKTVSLIACFTLLIGIMSFALPEAEKSLTLYKTDGTEVKSAEIKAFDHYRSIKREINNYLSLEKFEDVLYGAYSKTGELATAGWDDSSSFGKTYVQVDGVDEADILKNDGKYIYYLNEDNIIFIYEGEKLVTKITDFDYEQYHTSEYSYEGHYDFSEHVEDMFVADHKLIVNTYSRYNENKKEDEDEYRLGYTYPTVYFTNSYIYDLSDISNPKLLKKFTNSGIYQASRIIGDMLYIVSNKYSKSDYVSEEDCYIYVGEDDELTALPASSIMYGESVTNSNCLVLSAININKMERTADTKAFLGCSSDIYCCYNNMYISLWGSDSQIVKVELTENEIKFACSVTVNGDIHNQFSMNEKDGYFRVATSDKKGNNLFVFDNKLNLAGSVTGFAEGEDIKSVNYIDDMAYVITYEEIDPLFAIDVSDPTNPVIKGSLEITGFSSQLVPIDDNILLGIGYEDGVQLVLFDISNPLDLKVLDSYVMADSGSNTQVSHKAITINREKNYIVIDHYKLNNYSDGAESFVLAFNTENDRINIIHDYKVDFIKTDAYEDYSVKRTTYIGDTLYVLDSKGNIYSFAM